MTPLEKALVADIARTGPITLAAFMERALYDPAHGYYAVAPRRSGRQGHFYTSVDVGPLFGRLLANAVAARWRELADTAGTYSTRFDLVEVGAGDGRLMCDVLDALEATHPTCYSTLRVHLVERSATARTAADARVARHAARIESSSAEGPRTVAGLMFANELLDAFPVHRLVRRGGDLREVWVTVRGGRLAAEEHAVSTPALVSYMDRAGIELDEGVAADLSPAALDWLMAAGRTLQRGFLLIIDYGHRRGAGNARRTSLRAYDAHRLCDGPAGWLERPGERDLTANVDFAALRLLAPEAELIERTFASQAQFLLDSGLADAVECASGSTVEAVRRRLSTLALVGPGSPGTTHAAWLLEKRGGAGTPPFARDLP